MLGWSMLTVVVIVVVLLLVLVFVVAANPRPLSLLSLLDRASMPPTAATSLTSRSSTSNVCFLLFFGLLANPKKLRNS